MAEDQKVNDGKQPYDAEQGNIPVLKQEDRESERAFAVRLLASMFQEIYSHTGREMPGEMFERCEAVVECIIDSTMDKVREDKRNGYL